MTDEERLIRGQQAGLEYRELEAAFAKVEAVLVRTLTETPIGADPKVLRLHMSIQNLAAVKQALLAVAQDGMMAEHAIAVAGLTRPN